MNIKDIQPVEHPWCWWGGALAINAMGTWWWVAAMASSANQYMNTINCGIGILICIAFLGGSLLLYLARKRRGGLAERVYLGAILSIPFWIGDATWALNFLLRSNG